MRKTILLILSLCTMFSACQKFDDTNIWDSINSLDERVTALEKLCREMNTNIDALQALVKALETQDYITNVSPIQENGKVIGYTISFANGDPITIYHGADGQDGANGVDGQTPIIGVAKDSDGIYYWTLNGQWLLDEDGQKIKAVGTDGKDGITPQLKIDNGMWYVSYDNGTSWVEVGQATGDQGPQGETGAQGPQGPAGSDGQNSDSFFQSVTQDEENVYLVLADGTEIIIPKIPPVAATLVLDNISGFTATFNGTVNRSSRDLKVTVYYGTTDNLTVYKYKGKVSVTEFNGDTFTLKLTELAAETTYYYFTEVICNGDVTFSDIMSFRTGNADSYVDWGEGENVGGDI